MPRNAIISFVALDFLEGLLQHLDGILAVAGKKLFERTRDARGSLGQTITVRVISGPFDKGSDCCFDLGPVWPIRRRAQ